MSEAFPNRRFQIWEYRVSHGSLLIRSPKGPDAATNVDLVFAGVEYISCPRMMRGLELVSARSVDAQRAAHEAGPLLATDEVFVLLSAGVRYLVVATSCHVSENTDDIFDSPFR